MYSSIINLTLDSFSTKLIIALNKEPLIITHGEVYSIYDINITKTNKIVWKNNILFDIQNNSKHMLKKYGIFINDFIVDKNDESIIIENKNGIKNEMGCIGKKYIFNDNTFALLRKTSLKLFDFNFNQIFENFIDYRLSITDILKSKNYLLGIDEHSRSLFLTSVGTKKNKYISLEKYQPFEKYIKRNFLLKSKYYGRYKKYFFKYIFEYPFIIINISYGSKNHMRCSSVYILNCKNENIHKIYSKKMTYQYYDQIYIKIHKLVLLVWENLKYSKLLGINLINGEILFEIPFTFDIRSFVINVDYLACTTENRIQLKCISTNSLRIYKL